ncbi:TPA: DUF1542 domain-containing protein, partial [Streptococcus suis]|nr:DUF1542 domain-containing protein [Streptococcus suis]HEM5238832.1 DUF1542 domain-containing protein [Streptococcus suis]
MNRSKKKSFDWYGVRQRFSIRKYHIGAASVLLGMTLVLGTGTIVSAETGDNGGGTSDGIINQPVDEPIIKFPTQDNQAQPAGYQKVEFQPANGLSDLSFENKPGEIQNGNFKTVVFWVKNGTTWGALMSDPQFRIPKYTVADGDFILSYASNVGQVAYPIDFDALKDTPIVDRWQINTIVDYIIGDVTDGKTFEEYMNSGAYKPFQIPQFHGITLDANGGTIGGKEKKAFYVAYQHVQWGDQRVTSKIVDPSRDGYTFVRWQTATGEGIPTSGQIDTIEFTAVWLEHPTDKVAVFDRTNLTDSEKEQVKKKIYDANPDLSTGVAQVIKAIEISDTGEATVTFDDDKVVTVPSTTLINEDQDTARSNAKAEIEREATEKSDAINDSALTEEEKRARLTEVRDVQDRADIAIDNAATTEDLTKAISDGTAAIEAVSTTSTIKTKAKEALEEAYNTKKDEIDNSSLTAEEKSAKQEELDQAKSAADSAIDTATDDAGVGTALNKGKADIEAIGTIISDKKIAARQQLEDAYSAKETEITNSNLTLEEKATKLAELDKAKEDAENAIDTATDNAGVDAALEAGKTAIAGIDTSTSPKKAQAKQDLETAYNAKKDEIANSSLTAEEKATKLAELDKAKEDAENAIDTATDNAGVAKALEDGKATIDAINTSTSAKKAQAKKDLEAAYNAKKAEIENSALTAEEKAAKQAELDKAKADADKAIDAATDNAGVAKALEAGKAAIDAINTTTSAEKTAAKKDLEAAYNAKKAEIENSALTAEEKAAKQAELDKAKETADKAIDVATDASGVAKALEAGKAAIDAINTSTSAEKAQAKKDLEAAYNAKKAEIENSALTVEEKAAKQAELDKAKADADKAIDAATDASGVAKALEAGKAAIDAINTSTSAEKAAAKKDLEDAYNAKKAEIENSALTAEEKSAKQAELDKAKADADKAIDAATDNTGVAKALEDGKSAIDAINTTTSAEKAAAKKDLEDAYNAKKDEIAKSSLTAEEKAAKQAELDKAKE